MPLLAVLLAGCSSPEEIRTYTVARHTEAPPSPRPAEKTVLGDVRFLGAIVPTGDGHFNWYVKFVGPAAVVSAAEKEFDAFLASMTISGEGADRNLAWTVPAGWKENPAPRQMRTTTFLVGPPGKAVECYVSTKMSGGDLENVNRWRTGDAGLPEIAKDDLPTCTREITVAGAKALRVDLTGPGGKGSAGMRPPFAGGPNR